MFNPQLKWPVPSLHSSQTWKYGTANLLTHKSSEWLSLYCWLGKLLNHPHIHSSTLALHCLRVHAFTHPICYIPTKASGYVICVWLINRTVRSLVPFLSTQPLALAGIYLPLAFLGTATNHKAISNKATATPDDIGAISQHDLLIHYVPLTTLLLHPHTSYHWLIRN